MADVHNKKTRSYNMSRIRSADTGPELTVRKYLHRRGLRYLLDNKKLPGKPDLVFPRFSAVVFINGCFWHGHEGCKYFVLPKTRRKWWRDKIEGTRRRDKKANTLLKENEWNVLTVWECELKGTEKLINLEKLFYGIKRRKINERN